MTSTTLTAGVTRRRPTAVLPIILVGYFMVIVDNSIVITGLPRIRAEFGLSTGAAAWVQDAYLLTFGGLLLLGARAGDIFGRRRTFVGGLVLFTAASAAVGFAPTGAWLIAARGVQGVGAAVLVPSTLALLAASFPEGRDRIRATSAYGAVAGVGASVGLVAGGLLADLVSWRAGAGRDRLLPGGDARGGRAAGRGARGRCRTGRARRAGIPANGVTPDPP